MPSFKQPAGVALNQNREYAAPAIENRAPTQNHPAGAAAAGIAIDTTVSATQTQAPPEIGAKVHAPCKLRLETLLATPDAPVLDELYDESITSMLDEAEAVLLTIHDRQSMMQMEACVKYQKLVHSKLLRLATAADRWTKKSGAPDGVLDGSFRVCVRSAKQLKEKKQKQKQQQQHHHCVGSEEQQVQRQQAHQQPAHAQQQQQQQQQHAPQQHSQEDDEDDNGEESVKYRYGGKGVVSYSRWNKKELERLREAKEKFGSSTKKRNLHLLSGFIGTRDIDQVRIKLKYQESRRVFRFVESK